MKKHILYAVALAAMVSAVAILTPEAAFAVDEAEEGIDEIETSLSQEEEQASRVDSPDVQTKRPEQEIKGVSDLATLSPLSDIAVIQKRFLPKTGRFEGHLGLSGILNDAFFTNFGLNARLAYYFRERYGVEFTAISLTTAERQVTTDLREKREVETTSLITPKSYYGVAFRWTPVYGKMSWRNKSIVPFDLYFTGGGGVTNTNLGTGETTIQAGTGQVFALSKAMAFRWDFSWMAYAGYNNLYLNLGMSFFFPEATYR